MGYIMDLRKYAGHRPLIMVSARREIFEETGLECLHLSYFTNQSGKEMHYTYPNGDEVYIAEIVFLCDKYKGQLQVQEEEAVEQRFFPLNHFPENISPVNKGVLQMLISKFPDKTT